jgi:hypothetical protein
MSNTFLAIMPHPFRGIDEVLSLPDRLAGLFEVAQAVADTYSGERLTHETHWRWGWYQEESSPEQDWEKYGCAWFDGPGGTTVGVGRSCLFVDTVAKWHVARLRPDLLVTTDRLFRSVAEALDAPLYVATHDGDTTWELVLDGNPIEQVIAGLDGIGRKRVSGVDSLPIAHADRDDYEYNVYYVRAVKDQ